MKEFVYSELLNHQKEHIMATNESNNTLYFIVGGLVVLALVFGFIYFYTGEPTGRTIAGTSPAAGMSSTLERDETKTEININDDGIKGSITDRDVSND
jgi:hypothetical protein